MSNFFNFINIVNSSSALLLGHGLPFGRFYNSFKTFREHRTDLPLLGISVRFAYPSSKIQTVQVKHCISQVYIGKHVRYPKPQRLKYFKHQSAAFDPTTRFFKVV